MMSDITLINLIYLSLANTSCLEHKLLPIGSKCPEKCHAPVFCLKRPDINKAVSHKLNFQSIKVQVVDCCLILFSANPAEQKVGNSVAED